MTPLDLIVWALAAAAALVILAIAVALAVALINGARTGSRSTKPKQPSTVEILRGGTTK